jgi:hypothetical protein
LHLASECGETKVVLTLLEHGAYVEAMDKVPAFHACARHSMHGNVSTQSSAPV